MNREKIEKVIEGLNERERFMELDPAYDGKYGKWASELKEALVPSEDERERFKDDYGEAALAVLEESIGIDPRPTIREEMGYEQLDAFRQSMEAMVVYTKQVLEEKEAQR